MLLKSKRDWSVKAWGCTYGSLHMEYTKIRKQALPAVSLEAMMLSRVIDTEEERYAVVTEKPGAFYHTDMEGTIDMLFAGQSQNRNLILVYIANAFAIIKCKANVLRTTEKGFVQDNTNGAAFM